METAQAAETGEATENAEATQAEETTQEAQDDGYKYAGKFSSVEDLEKGYKELGGKLREKNPGAPEEYSFDALAESETLADYKDKVAELNLQEDAYVQAMIPAFKEVGLTQEQADKLISTYLQADFANMIDAEEERGKLGSEANELINKVKTFNEKLPEAERAYLESITSTADGVRFASKLIDMMGEKPIPDDDVHASAQVDYNELIAEANKVKAVANFGINKQAQARYEKLMDEAMRAKMRQEGN
jgi:hypothetical protein